MFDASLFLRKLTHISSLAHSSLLNKNQVLKPGGVCWIAEVKSRFDGSTGVASIDSFITAATKLGFKLQGSVDTKNKMFFTCRLVKSTSDRPENVNWPPLKACTYKKR